MYNESKKLSNGEYKKIRDYCIWVANPKEDLKNGDYVKIKSILSVSETHLTYKDGRKIFNITMTCEIEDNKPKQNNEQINFDGNPNDDFDFDKFNIDPNDFIL